MAEYNPSKIIKDGNTYNFRDTTKIPLSGSNQISGDLVPSTDGAVNLGGSSYQWNNAYIKSLTINGVVCGDILTHNAAEFASKATTLSGYGITDAYTKTQVDKKVSDLVNSAPETLDTLNELASALGNDPNFATTVANQIGTKANDSEVVKLSGNQTIAGIKSFSNDIRISKASPFCNVFSSGYIKGVAPSDNLYQGVRFYDDDSSSSPNHIVGGFEAQYDTSGYNIFSIHSRNYDQNNVQIWRSVGLYVPNDNTRPVQFAPIINNGINLGSSALQWNNTYTRNILIDNDINIASSLINKTSTSGVISIRGGVNDQEGASISLYGKDYSGSAGLVGNIYMTAYGNSDYTNFRIYPNGIIRVYNNSTNKTKNVAMQEDVIPRSGGAVITGLGLGRNVNNDQLRYHGGMSWNMGATLSLYGKEETSFGGRALIHPSDGTDSKNMWIYPNGTWTWDGTACQVTSDQRYKQQITEIDDALLDAWEDVELSQFKYNDAVEEKGNTARLHTGYVVQQIDDACKSHNVDISKYGLYCHEEYPEETEEVEVEQADGTKTKERKVIREASEHYSLRYTEALIVECKYLRRCVARLTARIEELEKGNNAK